MLKNKTVLTVAAAMTLLLGACSPSHEAGTIDRPEVSDVALEEVHLVSVPESYQTTGTVVPKTSSTISSRVMGTVTSLLVKEGDTVRKGQLLLTIDDRDLKEKLRGAEEAHNQAIHALESALKQEELANKTFERYRKLHEDKAITTQELDNVTNQANQARHGVEQARAVVKRTEASVEEARIFLGFSRVISSIDGIVTAKMIDVGSMASPGVPLLQLEDRAARLVEAGFEERMLDSVKEGMQVKVSVPSNAEESTGRIFEVIPTVDPHTRTFLVKIEIPGVDLRSGQYGMVRFASGTRDLLLVPASAVITQGQLTGVYRVGPDKGITYRLIRVGRRYGDRVEVLSGLDPGDTIIVGNLDRAVDGGILVPASLPGGGN